MRIAIDISDVIQVVKKGEPDVDVYHVVLTGLSGQSLLAAWEQKKRDDDGQPTLSL